MASATSPGRISVPAKMIAETTIKVRRPKVSRRAIKLNTSRPLLRPTAPVRRRVSLERITIGLNRRAVQSNRVKPLYIKCIERIHPFCLNRRGIQSKQDLL
jgi:hypothetical protein